MNGLGKRIERLEQARSSSSQLVITTSWGGTDDDGNETSELSSVSGCGWGVHREEGEAEEDFRARAKAVAAENGKPDLWEGPCIEATIGGEHES